MRLAWLIGQRLRSRGGRAVLALAAIALILIAGNVITARYGAVRLDLTAEHLYTLAHGTRQTLAKLEEPVTLRFYYSPKLGDAAPRYGVYAQQVRELLDQYVAAGHGKLRLEVYDPQPYSDAEDRAVAYGLQAVPLNGQGEAVYFGLAGTNSTDDQQVIQFFNPERERFLEYDLTRLVHTLAMPKRTVVGVMSTIPLVVDPTAPLMGKPTQSLAVINQLRQVDDVQEVAPTVDAIPATIDVLMLVHPQKLSDATLFAIDQFVLRGGKALVFVDPYSELQAGLPSPHTEQAAPPPDSNLEPLFKAWGVSLQPRVVAGDRLDARRVAVPVEGKPPRTMDYVGWLNLPVPNLNRDDPVTADLNEITMASAGILQPLEGATTHFVPLIKTSVDSAEIPVDKIKGLPDVAELLAHFRPEQRQFVLAARITGDVQSAFPGGKPEPPPPSPHDPNPPPPPPKDPSPPVPALKQSAGPVNIIVVADTDMLDDRFWVTAQDFFGKRLVQPVANNGDFVANAIETLAGGSDLIGLRGRGTTARPFEVVERIQRSADDRYAAEQRSLQDKLKQAQAKLASLTSGKGDKATPNAITAEQAKEIDGFRAEMLATRQQLRQVQAAERQDIQHLKVILEFFDIALMPLVVVVAAVVMAALRPRRRRSMRA